MAAQQPTTSTTDDTDDDDMVYAEATIECLVCVGTGREWLALGLMRCKHGGGTGERTIKRRLTPHEMTILAHAFEDEEDESEPTDDGKEAR